MNTKTIADYANVHVNTVRLYEQWGYISPVPRAANGYRQYTAVHQQQMMIARLAFRQELIQIPPLTTTDYTQAFVAGVKMEGLMAK